MHPNSIPHLERINIYQKAITGKLKEVRKSYEDEFNLFFQCRFSQSRKCDKKYQEGYCPRGGAKCDCSHSPRKPRYEGKRQNVNRGQPPIAEQRMVSKNAHGEHRQRQILDLNRLFRFNIPIATNSMEQTGLEVAHNFLFEDTRIISDKAPEVVNSAQRAPEAQNALQAPTRSPGTRNGKRVHS